MNVNRLMIVMAIGETGAGIALLVVPTAVAKLLLGTPLTTSSALVIARVAGAAILALGLACWLARNDDRSHGCHALVAGMLIYNSAVSALLTDAALRSRMHGFALWPATIFHVLLTIWCATSLTFPPVQTPTN